MNVEGQHNPKDVECIPVENLEVLPSGADWQSRHLESERRKAEIRDRIHKQAEQGQKTAKDYFRPAGNSQKRGMHGIQSRRTAAV
jgi:hypothetical protein